MGTHRHGDPGGDSSINRRLVLTQKRAHAEERLRAWGYTRGQDGIWRMPGVEARLAAFRLAEKRRVKIAEA